MEGSAEEVGRRRLMLALAFGALATISIVTFGVLASMSRPSPPSAAAIIAAGEVRGQRELADQDDPDLADDEAAAGAMWARINHPADASKCPRYSAAFLAGAHTRCREDVASRTSAQALVRA
jgi:hypothetical protein